MTYKENYSPSITDLIMATLGSARSPYLFRKILLERKLKKYKTGSVRVALSRLHSKGYTDNTKLGWCTTTKGKMYIGKKYLLDYFLSPFDNNSLKNIIISFDIPVQNRILRDWLRNQVKIFGYKMIQQSLWIGPGPLPALFLKRLEDLNIRKNVKTFKINKKG